MDKKLAKEVIDWVIHVGVAVLLAVLVILFLGRFAIVDGNSMAPTLKNHDFLIIESVTTRFGTIKQGDILVLRIPELLENKKKYAIKRVIATERQHVLIKDGKVFVDGIELEEDYINDTSTLPGQGMYSDMVVPDGCIYVLGDNRLPDKSRDSRVFGPVSKSRAVGRCFLRVFPFSAFGPVN